MTSKKGKLRILIDVFKVRRATGVNLLQLYRKMRKAKMLDYPTVLPLTCVQTCIEIVRNRQLAERKQEFAHCGWNVQGYIQGTLLGQPSASEASTGIFGEAPPSEEDLDELYAAFQEIDEASREPAAATAYAEAENPQDIATVLAIVTAVMKLIELWKNRK